MCELVIRHGQVRNPDTNYLLASRKTFRTSLVRESPEVMVDEVLNKIFTN
jgi:hypothetical protein